MNIKDFFLAFAYSVYLYVKSLNVFNFDRTSNIEKKKFYKYLKENNKTWRESTNKQPNKILIFSIINHPGYLITETLIAKNISKILNYEITVITNKEYIDGIKIINSFSINKIFFLNKISFIERIFFLFKAYLILRSYKSIKKFTNLSINKINFGRVIYDHIIRFSNLNDSKNLNYKFIFFLAESLFYNQYFNFYFKKNKFEYLIMSENQFIPSNFVFQNALKYGTKVVCRSGGPKRIGLKIFNNLNERYYPKLQIPNNVFKKIFKYKKKIYSQRGLNSIKKILQGKIRHYDAPVQKNLNYQNKSLINKNRIYKYFNWDINKKVCIIFSNNLFDGNYGTEKRLFLNNLLWLRNTLDFIKKIESKVYWIIKEHPSDYGIERSKTNTVNEFNKIIGENKNIKLFPNHISIYNIKEFVSCVVTSMGSPGLEYPCFGIPSIVCGSSFYTGLGFTYEPKNENQYFYYLQNVNKIISKKLTDNQIQKARVYYYLLTQKTKLYNNLLTNFEISRKLNLEKFFFENSKIISKRNPYKNNFFIKLKKQINNKQSILLN
jgi:hypothetical protein